MNNKIRQSVSLLITTVLLVSYCALSCTKSSTTSPSAGSSTFSAALDGAQETPPISTAATGTLTATYDANNNNLTYTLTWSNLSGAPSAMHFHKGKIGEAGGVEVPITGFASAVSGSFSSTAMVDENEEGDLLEEHFYVNIHTPTNPGGEIRGQLLLK